MALVEYIWFTKTYWKYVGVVGFISGYVPALLRFRRLLKDQNGM